MSAIVISTLRAETVTPFLYPCLDDIGFRRAVSICQALRRPSAQCKVASPVRCLYTSTSPTSTARACTRPHHKPRALFRCISTSPDVHDTSPLPLAAPTAIDIHQYDHLSPQPADHSNTHAFADSCSLTLQSGSGGHGCISFLREKYIPNGPPNGGDGGAGGSIYIQAVAGESSLHKLARRGVVKAARGRNGEGGLRNGKRGDDTLVLVPVGTVVREVWRKDPFEEDRGAGKGFGSDLRDDSEGPGARPDQRRKRDKDRWLIYPGTLPRSFSSAEFPPLPRPRKSSLAAAQPKAPMLLDLDKPMSTPLLLAAGAVGGMGNPHFVTRSLPRPKFATKGEDGLTLHLQLELKLLADVGLVGLPNAGKSTLLRALSKSRTRVGDWPFTTLAPSIGTVVLDSLAGRPLLSTRRGTSTEGEGREEPRTGFAIADIPGLIEDAHLNRGLGLSFLRHIERAAMLAFVVDLSAGDAVTAVKALWKEVGQYEIQRERELHAESECVTEGTEGVVSFKPFDPAEQTLMLDPQVNRELPEIKGPSSISSKPWFVVATKADLPSTQDNFLRLQDWLRKVQSGEEGHPSGKQNAWRKEIFSVPVSAIKKEGVKRVPEIVVRLLQG